MKILWTDFATEMLKDIFVYYKKNANLKVARSIKSKIISATKPLTKQPEFGQIELSLEILQQGHRYIVEANYKIIYKKVNEVLLITDVFDCRQDPIKINNEKRKPSL